MRYDPWDDLRRLQEELDKVVGEIRFGKYRKFPKRMFPSKKYPDEKDLVAYSEPLSDVIDKEDELKVIMDLPGIKKQDISIKVNERSVEVKAEKKIEQTEEREGYFFQERGYQGYARVFALPEKVVPEKTQATYNNGVLEVTMKKSQPKETKGFDVNIE